jgi:hypothetical protein
MNAQFILDEVAAHKEMFGASQRISVSGYIGRTFPQRTFSDWFERTVHNEGDMIYLYTAPADSEGSTQLYRLTDDDWEIVDEKVIGIATYMH